MELSEVKRLMKNLSWNMPQEVQLSVIRELTTIDDEYTPLLIQDTEKHCWENAVKVLNKIGYPRNRLAIPCLIELMQDMNWPGVPTAIEILKSIDKSVIVPHIEASLIKAAEDDDRMWIGGIQRLIDILQISESDFHDKEVYKLLKLSDW